jgi:hypothetical protein
MFKKSEPKFNWDEHYKRRKIEEDWSDFILDMWFEMVKYNPEIKMSFVRNCVIDSVIRRSEL